MIGKNKWASMRWRIVMIYFMLVFIAMAIVSVFIIRQLEAYQVNSIRESLTKTVTNSAFLAEFQQYENLRDHAEEIQATVEQNWANSYQEALFVVDASLSTIASSNNLTDTDGTVSLDYDLITESISSNQPEDRTHFYGELPVMDISIPIEHNGEIIGSVYVRADLSSTFAFVSQSKSIFVRAMVLALLVTVFLGFFIASSITVPINDVTEKAERMAQGDFSQEVSVMSDDEIGRLAEMFNLLRRKLDYTLSEMSNEKRKLETILRYMADGLIAAEPTGRLIHVNPAASVMLDIEEEDVVEKTYDELMARYDSSLLFDTLREQGKKEGDKPPSTIKDPPSRPVMNGSKMKTMKISASS